MILQHCQALTAPASRIVSLVPSQTELLYTLGLHAETIAITKFCIHPKEWHQSKIRVGGTKAVDVQRVLSLNPDLVIANKEENVQGQVDELASSFPVWLSDVNSVSEAYRMITDVGVLTGKNEDAKRLVAEIKSKFLE